MKKTVFLMALLLTINVLPSYAFCGFYVAKADTKLYNESSQVILVRDGNRTVITMSNDFQGDVRDFAMVVPVPVVLQRDDIRVADRQMFDIFDAYSAPRLVEYHDQDPCQHRYKDVMPTAKSRGGAVAEMAVPPSADAAKMNYGVTIQAKYTVGEYDILILSATQSNGLERWLTDNGYKIPAGARDVLQPYIMSKTKFFVAKVNLTEHDRLGVQELRPLQISFDSPKFMLPIRLGMANSKGNQDLIIYAMSKKGRVECVNYPTLNMTTDRNIPEFVQQDFGNFYKDMFAKKWNVGKKGIYLEYAWDISPRNYVKCDPCVSTPPDFAQLEHAGVDWINNNNGGMGFKGGSRGAGIAPNPNADNGGNVFFTRLHVRYNRANYPQDLMFQETPNQQNFQARYIITHPAQSNFDCQEAAPYLKKVVAKRRAELNELASLTGWDISDHRYYVEQYQNLLPQDDKKNFLNWFVNPNDGNNNGGGNLFPILEILLCISLVIASYILGIRAWTAIMRTKSQ